VLRFLEKTSDGRRVELFANNTFLKNYGNKQNRLNNYLFHFSANAYESDLEYEKKILRNMLNIQLKLKRLNKLWLPEYEELRKLIYEPKKLENTHVRNTIIYYNKKEYKTSLNVQKAIYRAETESDMKFLLADIIALVLENTALIDFETFEEVCAREEDVVPRRIDCGSDTEKRYIFINAKSTVNVENHYSSDYKTKETLLLPKVQQFVSTLKSEPLKNNFMKQFPLESSIVKNIIVNELSEYLHHPKRLYMYIKNYVEENNVFDENKVNQKNIFLGNCSKLISYSAKQKNVETKNSELYFNVQDNIEFPDKYISYPEFELKLSNINKPQFAKYVSSVDSAKGNVVFFLDKIENLNNKLENKQQMIQFYNKYILIYSIVSFLYLVDVSLSTYYGKNVLDLMKHDDSKCVDGNKNEKTDEEEVAEGADEDSDEEDDSDEEESEDENGQQGEGEKGVNANNEEAVNGEGVEEEAANGEKGKDGVKTDENGEGANAKEGVKKHTKIMKKADKQKIRQNIMDNIDKVVSDIKNNNKKMITLIPNATKTINRVSEGAKQFVKKIKINKGNIEIPPKLGEKIVKKLKSKPVKTILSQFKDKIKSEIDKNTSNQQFNEIKDILKKQQYFNSEELETIFKVSKK
jgi:hypothetical protein